MTKILNDLCINPIKIQKGITVEEIYAATAAAEESLPGF